MIRKQFYLTERQNSELIRKAADAGVSEAEYVRRALDHAISGRSVVAGLRHGSSEAMDRIEQFWLDTNSVLLGDFSRDELYQERLKQVADAKGGVAK